MKFFFLPPFDFLLNLVIEDTLSEMLLLISLTFDFEDFVTLRRPAPDAL